jgi:hypothetical protein
MSKFTSNSSSERATALNPFLTYFSRSVTKSQSARTEVGIPWRRLSANGELAMKLSIYTFVKDGIYFDFHVAAMLKHHLALADEIIVNEGYSKDGTYEAICDLDPKIKIFRNVWDTSDPKTWYVKFKEEARRQCTGEWCILLDCDEFIPEWEFGRIRNVLTCTDKHVHGMRYLHFYGNYKVLSTNPEKFGWPVYKRTIHRNLENIEIWGDGSNVRLRGVSDSENGDPLCDCHHFGFVRHPARLRQKWRIQQKMYHSKKPRWDRTPGFLFDLLPHAWEDKDFLGNLAVHKGPFVKAVTDDPAEFTRDDLELYNLLTTKSAGLQVGT